MAGGGWITVSSGYFEVFRIPVKRGRAFTIRDDGAAPPVVIINESMATRFWKGADPMNDRLVHRQRHSCASSPPNNRANHRHRRRQP